MGRKAYQRRTARKRYDNRKREIRNEELKKQQDNRRSNPRGEGKDDSKDNPRKDSPRSSTSGVDGGFFKVLLILVIAVILGVAAYMLFVDGPVQGGSAKILYDQEMNPDAVQLSELEIKINAAKDANDFRSATRLYFVWVIKELSDKGHIQWKKRKTNYHYLLEVESKSFSEDFGTAVNNYEFIWYGKYEVKPEEFTVVENHFKELISKIN